MSIDRSIKPQTHEVRSIVMPHVEHMRLGCGVELHVIEGGEASLVPVIAVIGCGSVDTGLKALAGSMTSMLSAGSAGMSAGEMAQRIDECGAWIGASSGKHVSKVHLLSLRRTFRESMRLLADVLLEPNFESGELMRLQAQQRTNFAIGRGKVRTVAGENLLEMLFGREHPYVGVREAGEYDLVTVDELRRFHSESVCRENVHLVMTTPVKEELIPIIEEELGGRVLRGGRSMDFYPSAVVNPGGRRREVIGINGAQSCVCIGRRVNVEGFDDNRLLAFMTTILGGYFGSRLMQNVREDKGLTYGIGAVKMVSLCGGYLSISCECDNSYVRDVIGETYAEMDRLCCELVDVDEIARARNYLIGAMMQESGASVSWNSRYVEDVISERSMWVDLTYAQRVVDHLYSVTPESLRETAQRWLVRDEFVESIAGSPVL